VNTGGIHRAAYHQDYFPCQEQGQRDQRDLGPKMDLKKLVEPGKRKDQENDEQYQRKIMPTQSFQMIHENTSEWEYGAVILQGRTGTVQGKTS
jgi:hypothetical protein